MSKKVVITLNQKRDIEIECQVIETGNISKRVEECHGYHTFEDFEVSKTDFIKCILHLNCLDEIDITDRLTQREKDLLYETIICE